MQGAGDRDLVAGRLGIACLGLDLFFMLVFLGFAAAVVEGLVPAIPWRVDLGSEGSLASHWGYLKWLLISATLTLAWGRGGAPVLLVLAAVFAMIWLDDFFELHEALGLWLAEAGWFADTLALRGQDFGELLGFGLLGALSAGLFLRGFLHSDGNGRREGLRFLGLIALLGVFGVVADMAHVAIMRLGDAEDIDTAMLSATLVEDGGELVVGSLLLWRALLLLGPARREVTSLWIRRPDSD